MATNDDNTGLTIAVIGGGVVLLWLLWRGRGTGNGGGKRGSGASQGSESWSGVANRPPAFVKVSIRSGDRIELDGVPSDLATTVARSRAAGEVHVHATGDAREGWVRTVLDALRGTGSKIAKDVSIGPWT